MVDESSDQTNAENAYKIFMRDILLVLLHKLLFLKLASI